METEMYCQSMAWVPLADIVSLCSVMQAYLYLTMVRLAAYQVLEWSNGKLGY